MFLTEKLILLSKFFQITFSCDNVFESAHCENYLMYMELVEFLASHTLQNANSCKERTSYLFFILIKKL